MASPYSTLPEGWGTNWDPPGPIDPVTFQPYPPGTVALVGTGDVPVVKLALEYDPEPEGFGRTAWGVPAWLLLLAGAYVTATYFGARI